MVYGVNYRFATQEEASAFIARVRHSDHFRTEVAPLIIARKMKQ